MSEQARHDAWQAGDSYDLYMGRWSRQIAPLFLDWLQVPEQRDWLEVGCGTGALSAAIIKRCAPKSLTCVEPSEGFLAKAQSAVPDHRASYLKGDALALPVRAASQDVVVSGLVLNFVPDRQAAWREMIRTARPQGTVALYVWDYPGGGIEFMRAFWTAATALDVNARDLTEDRRFPFCTREKLSELASGVGLCEVATTALEAQSRFRDFDDYWHPFTLGAGPAPGYCASLEPAARQRLKERLQADLPRGHDGSIALNTRAWAVKARVG